MPPQWENLCVTGTLFLFGRSSLTVAGIACDIWRTSVCYGARVGNRGGGGGSNLGRRRSSTIRVYLTLSIFFKFQS